MTPEQDIKKKQDNLTFAHGNHGKGLNSYASFKVGDKDLGQDLVQDTFLKTWKYLVKGGKVISMKAFLYHILNGLIIDTYRKNKPTSLNTLLEKGFDPSTDDTEERVFERFDGKTLLSQIQHLPETYKKVIRMRYMQELSLTEMSRITGKTKNSISVQVHRGLEKLKMLYQIKR